MSAEPIFRASSYDEVLAGLNARRKSLGLSMEVLDELAGIAKGYSGKVFGGKRVKTLGPLSFTCLIGALGGELWFVASAARHDGESDPKIMNLNTHFTALGQRGGRIVRARSTDARWSRMSRKGARSRWRKWRALKAEKARKTRRSKPIVLTNDPMVPARIATVVT